MFKKKTRQIKFLRANDRNYWRLCKLRPKTNSCEKFIQFKQSSFFCIIKREDSTLRLTWFSLSICQCWLFNVPHRFSFHFIHKNHQQVVVKTSVAEVVFLFTQIIFFLDFFCWPLRWKVVSSSYFCFIISLYNSRRTGNRMKGWVDATDYVALVTFCWGVNIKQANKLKKGNDCHIKSKGKLTRQVFSLSPAQLFQFLLHRRLLLLITCTFFQDIWNGNL